MPSTASSGGALLLLSSVTRSPSSAGPTRTSLAGSDFSPACGMAYTTPSTT